jgi:hypothetical protein
MNRLLIFFTALSFVSCVKDKAPVEVEPEVIPTFTYNALVYGKVTGCHDLLAIEMLDDADTFPYPLDTLIGNSTDNRVFAYNLPDSLSEPGTLISVELEPAHGPIVYYGPGCWGTPFLYNFVRLLEAAPVPE